MARAPQTPTCASKSIMKEETKIPNSTGTDWSDLESQLCDALCPDKNDNSDFAQAEKLLGKGADPNKTSPLDITICEEVLLGARENADKIVEFLLRHGLDPRAHEGRIGVEGLISLRWKGTPAVMRAAKLLLEAGADPTLPYDPEAPDGETCLQHLWFNADYNRWYDETGMGFDAQGVAACVSAFANGEPIDRFRSYMEVDSKRIESVKFISRPGEKGDGSGLGEILYGDDEYAHTFDGLVALICEDETLIATPGLVFYCNDRELEKKGTRTEDISRFFPGSVGERIRGMYCVHHSQKCPDSVVLDLGEYASLWFSLVKEDAKEKPAGEDTSRVPVIQEKDGFVPSAFEWWQVTRVL